MTTSVEVLVVGLGAMGSAVAYQLAKRGIDVVGIERYRSPHNHGSSHGESRVTRELTGEGLEYVGLAVRSHQIWRSLETVEGDLFCRTGGLLLKQQSGSAKRHGGDDFARQTMDVAGAVGVEMQALTAAQLRGAFPQFKVTDDTVGYLEAAAGFVRPERCVAAQLKGAEAGGARLRYDEAVLSIGRDADGLVVVTDKGAYRAGQVIVTAGAWIPSLLGGLFARRLQVLRQVQYWFSTPEPSLWSQDHCPTFIWFHGDRPEDFFYGLPSVHGGIAGVKVATEQYLQECDPGAMPRTVCDEEIEFMFRRHVAPHLNAVQMPAVQALPCLYTFNPGGAGRFMIGPHPDIDGVTVVSACSGHGFKHSAAIGESIAQQLVGETPTCDLRPFAF